MLIAWLSEKLPCKKHLEAFSAYELLYFFGLFVALSWVADCVGSVTFRPVFMWYLQSKERKEKNKH